MKFLNPYLFVNDSNLITSFPSCYYTTTYIMFFFLYFSHERRRMTVPEIFSPLFAFISISVGVFLCCSVILLCSYFTNFSSSRNMHTVIFVNRILWTFRHKKDEYATWEVINPIMNSLGIFLNCIYYSFYFHPSNLQI